MLAPGTPRDPIQIVDVRDLTAWMMKLVEARTTGYFNAISPPRQFTMGDVVAASLKESLQAGTKVTWVDQDFIAKTWTEDQVDLTPWWPTKGEYASAALTPTQCAIDTGLKTRPLQETVHDTLEWFRTLPADRQAKLKSGLQAQQEADALKAWHAKA